jgi:hypothetical protein
MLPREEYTDRQWSKKFAPKCRQCLQPEYATHKDVISGDGSKCASCGDPCQLFKGLCRFCELNKNDAKFWDARYKEAAKKREQKNLKAKADMQALEEKGIMLRIPEGTRRVYEGATVLYGLDE